MKPIGTIIYEGWGSETLNQVYYRFMRGEELPHLYVVGTTPFDLSGHVMYDRNYIDINTAMLEMFDNSPVVRWKNGGILKNNIPQQKALNKARKAFPVGSKVKWAYGEGFVAWHEVKNGMVKVVLDTDHGWDEFTAANPEDENFVPTGITLITEK